MPLVLKDVLKDKKLFPLLLAFSIKEHNDENILFLTDTIKNEVLYKKYVAKGAPKEINLPATIAKELHALAIAKKWDDKSMKPFMDKARVSITGLFQSDSLPRFEASSAYLTHVYPERENTIKLIPNMEKAITEFTKFFNTAIASVKSKGPPTDKVEGNRMFDSARMRHDKVHELFTERLQKDKSFNEKGYPDLFKDKKAFSSLYAVYRKEIKR